MPLICAANVALIKEFNLRRHYETKHQDKPKERSADATGSRKIKEESDRQQLTTQLLDLQLQGRDLMTTHR